VLFFAFARFEYLENIINARGQKSRLCCHNEHNCNVWNKKSSDAYHALVWVWKSSKPLSVWQTLSQVNERLRSQVSNISMFASI